MQRTIVIGDIHGGLRALKQLLERINIAANDKLIFLGDYVDGWSESPQVISFLIALGEDYDCIFIRGNHDDLCHKWLLNNEKNEQWLFHGGHSTIAAYEEVSASEKELHIAFFERMKNYHIDEKNNLFVHSGFQNHHGPQHEYYATAFYWDRTLWEMAVAINPKLTPDDPAYPRRLKHFEEIYIGHTPVTRIGKTVPTKRATVWNIDTGAAFKGPISAMDIHTKQVWQSDAVWKFYPDENGRN